VDLREAAPQGLDDRARVFHRQGRLRDERHAVRVRDRDRLRVLDGGDQPNLRRGLPHRALDLLVPRVADEQDLVTHPCETDRLQVHFGHERAGRVDHAQASRGGRGPHLRRNAVRGEDRRGPVGHLVELLYEPHAARLEVAHDVAVVDDLPPDVHGTLEAIEGEVHDLDRAHDPGAKAAWRGEEDPLDRENRAVGNHQPPRFYRRCPSALGFVRFCSASHRASRRKRDHSRPQVAQ
jgi:hypothetical protein